MPRTHYSFSESQNDREYSRLEEAPQNHSSSRTTTTTATPISRSSSVRSFNSFLQQYREQNSQSRDLFLPTKTFSEPVPLQDAIRSMIFSLLGAGWLALPFAMSAMGLVPGVISILMVPVIQAYSIIFLHRCCLFAGQDSYSQLALNHFGPKASVMIVVIAGLESFGIVIVYMTAIRECISSIIDESVHAEPYPYDIVSYLLYVIAVVLPVSIKIDILSWKRYSLLLVSIIGLYSAIVVIKAAFSDNMRLATLSDLDLYNFNADAFTALPIVIFSYSCASQFLTIYSDIEKPSSDRATKQLIGYPLGISSFLYTVTSIFGFLHFRDDTEPNILLNYTSKNNPFILVMRLSFIMLLTVLSPLAYQPLQRTIENIYLLYCSTYPIDNLTLSINESQSPIDVSLSTKFKVSETIIVFSSAAAISTFTSSLQEPISITGACFSALLNFTFPSLLYLKTIPEATFLQKLGPRLVSLFGIFVCSSYILSISYSLYSTSHE